MQKKNLSRQQIMEMADRVVSLTEAEAKALPGLLGRTVWAACFLGCGYRAVTVDGVKTFFQPKEA